MKKPPHIVLSHENTIQQEVLAPFFDEIAFSNLSFTVESRPPLGPQAALHWLIPTALVIYVSKSYFDEFLKQAGKDHSELLTKAIGTLAKSFFGPGRTVRRKLIGTAGKLPAELRYSLSISIVAEAEAGVKFKLLIPDDTSREELTQIASRFFDLLEAYYSQTLEEPVRTALTNARVIGRMILVAYDKKHDLFIFVDP